MNDQLAAAIVSDGLTVTYGRRTAVDNVTFAVYGPKTSAGWGPRSLLSNH